MSLTCMICLLCLLVPLGVVPQSIERERIAELYLVRSGLNTVDYEKIAATIDSIVSLLGIRQMWKRKEEQSGNPRESSKFWESY